MKHLLHKAATLCFAIVIAVASVNLGGVAQVNAAPGNNGTLKVHEKGTPAGTESNDPKVCVFNFEGSNFDVAQSGYLVVTTQPGGVNSLVMPFGPANASGYAETQYVNDTGSPYTLANGSYKVTVYGKDTGNPALPNYLDEKAKSKNFKVECAAPTPLNATPAAPTYVDLCGTTNDTYTLPATTGITYLVNGQPQVAGTYAGNGSVVIIAVANNGYTIPANVTKQWTFNFSATPCIVTVTATAPTFTDLCQTSNDTYTIPATTGVVYRVNGTVKAPGTYPGSGIVIVTASAEPNFVLQGTKVWTEVFSNLPCVVVPAEPTKNDVCGRANDTYTIPATNGARYFVNGVERGAGTYTATFPIIKITAVAKSGYVLDLREPFLWIFTYGDKRCPQPCHALTTFNFFNGTPLVADPDCIPVQVTTTAPSAVDVCGTANDTYTIPTTAGVVYRVNGVLAPAGTYPATGSVTITAHAADSGYVIVNGQTTSWSFDFTDVACPRADIAVTAECNIDGVLVKLENRGDADGTAYVNGTKVDVAKGDIVSRIVSTTLYKATVKVTTDASVVLLEQSYDCTPGQGAAGGPITRATPLSQMVTTPAPVTEFPQTGIGSWKQIYTGLILALITYGLTYYLQGRRKVTQE